MRASMRAVEVERVQPVEDPLQVVNAPAREEPVGARDRDAGAVPLHVRVDARAGLATARRRAARRPRERREGVHDLVRRLEEHVVEAVVDLARVAPERDHRRAVVVDGEPHALGQQAGERGRERGRGRDVRLARGAAGVEEGQLAAGFGRSRQGGHDPTKGACRPSRAAPPTLPTARRTPGGRSGARTPAPPRRGAARSALPRRAAA